MKTGMGTPNRPTRRGDRSRVRRDLQGDIPDFARWKKPAGGERGENSARAEESGDGAPPPMSETTAGGRCSWPDGEWPAERETANIEAGACVDQPPSPADIVDTWETASSGWDRRPEGDVPRSEPSALGARRLSPARPQPPISCEPRRDDYFSRSTVDGNTAHLTVLMLILCFWWFLAGGHWASLSGSQSSTCFQQLALGSSPAASSRGPVGPATTEMQIEPTAATAAGVPRSDHEQRTMSSKPAARNEATAICAGRAGSAERTTVTTPSRNDGGESVQAGQQRRAGGEPAAQNEATAIWSDSAGSCGQVRSAVTGRSGNSELRNRSAKLCDVQVANHQEGRKPGGAQSGLFLYSCITEIVLTAFG